jgi:hypothetical protein
MKPTNKILIASLMALTAAWPTSGTAQPTSRNAAAPATCRGTPNPPQVGDDDNHLAAVDALSRCSAWAVGQYRVIDDDDETPELNPLVLRWNGTQWKRQQTPSWQHFNGLRGVAATSANNAWAVGSELSNSVVLRWNGTAWKSQTTWDMGNWENPLNGVDASSSTNAWAAGSHLTFNTSNSTFGPYQNFILNWVPEHNHWFQGSSDGAPIPNEGQSHNGLEDVATTGPKNVWAVGWYYNDEIDRYQTQILRWNGTAWSRRPSPNVDSGRNVLNGATATSVDNAWAVGTYTDTASAKTRTLVLRWNGNVWKHQPSPNVGTGDNVLSEVTATSANNAWAVGTYINTTGKKRTLVLRWNGTTWKRQQSPNVGADENVLSGVTATAENNAWVVGWYTDPVSGESQSLVLRWNGTDWTR